MDESAIEDLSFYSCAGEDCAKDCRVVEVEGEPVHVITTEPEHCSNYSFTKWNDNICGILSTNNHIQDEVDMLGIENLISQIDLVLLNQPITFDQGRKRSRAEVINDVNDDDVDLSIAIVASSADIAVNLSGKEIEGTREKSASMTGALTTDNSRNEEAVNPLDDIEEDSFVFDLDEVDELDSLNDVGSDPSEDLDFNAIIYDAGSGDKIEISGNEFIEIDESLYMENIFPPSIYTPANEKGGDDVLHPPAASSTSNETLSSDERVTIVDRDNEERDNNCASAAYNSQDYPDDASRDCDEESVMSVSTLTIPSIEIPPLSILAPPTINEYSRRVIQLSADCRRKYTTANSRIKTNNHQFPDKNTLKAHSVTVKKSDVRYATLHWFNTDRGKEYSLDHDENIKPRKGFEKPTIASKCRLGSPRIITPTPSCAQRNGLSSAAPTMIIAPSIVKAVI